MNAQPQPTQAPQLVSNPYQFAPSYAPVIEQRNCRFVCIGYKRIERKPA